MGHGMRETDEATPDLPDSPQCAECSREVTVAGAISERWTYWSDGVGELHPYCPECAQREFGLPLRVRDPR